MSILSGFKSFIKYILTDDGYQMVSQQGLAKDIFLNDGTNIEDVTQNLKKSVSDGKTLVANAITAQGVTTATDAEFETMANNVTTVATNKYNAGVAATKVGTAQQAHVLTGTTFTNSSGVGLSGTMPNRGAWTGLTSGSGAIYIPEGYHNGQGYVSGVNSYNAGYNAGHSNGAGVLVWSGELNGNAGSISVNLSSYKAVRLKLNSFWGMTIDDIILNVGTSKVVGIWDGARTSAFYSRTITVSTSGITATATTDFNAMKITQIYGLDYTV